MERGAQREIQKLEFNFGFLSDEEAIEILETLNKLGYRKIPQNKPPLLSDGEMRSVRGKHNYLSIWDFAKAVAEAQREICIKYYKAKI